MYKILFLASAFLFIVLSIGCKKKNDNIQFSGNVFEPNIQNNINDVKVVLSAQIIESGTWNTNYTILQTTNTDVEGKFEIESENKRVSNYKISLSKDNYFDENYIINPDNVKSGEIYNENFNIYSESTININIKNISPVDSLDRMTYSIDGQSFSCSDCCSTSDKTFIGTSIDETVSCRIPGHQTIKINYYVVRNGNTVIKEITKYMPEFETINIDIFY